MTLIARREMSFDSGASKRLHMPHAPEAHQWNASRARRCIICTLNR